MKATSPPASLSLIDIGANLTSNRFSHDLESVIDRAKQAAIVKIIITGTDVETSEKAVELAKQYPEYLYTTAGIHPHDAKTLTVDSIGQLQQLASYDYVKAIGETGLDFNRNYSPPQQQIIAFEQQIELAIETGLPLFLHERDAFKQQHEILKSYRDQLSKAVIHCFTGSKQQCFKYLDLDLHIGITGWICDPKRGQDLREFVADIPIEYLMIETDAPYLPPKTAPKLAVAKKGRNEPCTLPYVAAAISELRNCSVSELASKTYKNSCDFFGL